MHQYRVELRVELGHTRRVDIMARNHLDAKYKAERQYSLLVLSTQLID